MFPLCMLIKKNENHNTEEENSEFYKEYNNFILMKGI